MSYFRELPDVDYQSFLSDSISSQSYLRVKNLFRRNKLRDDLKGVFTLFNKYQIPEGSRPDIVAEQFYGSADLDWVVLLTAGIINVRDEWPLSNYDLYRYVENLYGYPEINAARYYETKEVRDSNDRLILPKDLIVDYDFTIPDPEDYRGTLNPVRPVTNWEYEVRKNDEKSSIYLLRREYLQQFLTDMRRIMIYDRSSQYISEDLVRTENTRITTPN